MGTELRCTAPHPTVQGWVCRAKLNVRIPRGFEVRDGEHPECVPVTCWKCGAEYAVCPVKAA